MTSIVVEIILAAAKDATRLLRTLLGKGDLRFPALRDATDIFRMGHGAENDQQYNGNKHRPGFSSSKIESKSTNAAVESGHVAQQTLVSVSQGYIPRID